MDVAIPGSLAEFLPWLATDAAFIAVMVLLLERIPGWAALNADLKSFIAVVVAIGLGVASSALTTWFPAGIVPSAADVYKIVFNAMVIYSGSQYAHWRIQVLPDQKAETLNKVLESAAPLNDGTPATKTPPDALQG